MVHLGSMELDSRQTDHHATMVEIKGKVSNTFVSILIYARACRSYVSHKFVETCKLNKEKHEKLWLVQLATGTKRKVSKLVKDCEALPHGEYVSPKDRQHESKVFVRPARSNCPAGQMVGLP